MYKKRIVVQICNIIIYKCKSQIIHKLEKQKPLKYMFIFIEVILQNYYGMQVQILSEAT